MRSLTNKITHRTFFAGAVAAVLVLGSMTMNAGAAAAEVTLDGAKAFLVNLEKNRDAFLETEVPDVVLKGTDVCTSDGGSGCKYLAVLTGSMSNAVKAARRQSDGLDEGEIIDVYELPNDIRAGIAAAVDEDLSGEGSGEDRITVSISDEFVYAALLGMLDFAIQSTKDNIARIGN